MTRRREATIELADALGLEVEPGEATSDLMDRCIARAHSFGGGRVAQGRSDRDDEADEDSDEEQGDRVACGVVEAEDRAMAPTQPRKRRSRRGSNGQAALALAGFGR